MLENHTLKIKRSLVTTFLKMYKIMADNLQTSTKNLIYLV